MLEEERLVVKEIECALIKLLQVLVNVLLLRGRWRRSNCFFPLLARLLARLLGCWLLFLLFRFFLVLLCEVDGGELLLLNLEDAEHFLPDGGGSDVFEPASQVLIVLGKFIIDSK